MPGALPFLEVKAELKKKRVRKMLKSMTGFGRFETENADGKLSVEMKAVNHRYLDLNIKMPRRFNCFEAEIRNLLKADVSRGKVDIYIAYEDYRKNQGALKYNGSLAAEYCRYLRQMSEELGIENDVKTSGLARMPEVFTMEQSTEDDEELFQQLKATIHGAMEKFVESRLREGSHLREDLQEKLENMQKLVNQVEERSPEVLRAYHDKLKAKVEELLGDTSAEESRIAAEVILYADKICVDEETVRLKSHISHMSEALKKGGSVGRQLDFIAQEMNREANTILSKANDQQVTDLAISLKTEIEKVREQIQNIE